MAGLSSKLNTSVVILAVGGDGWTYALFGAPFVLSHHRRADIFSED
jgi:pyruvate/2-oxoacid:ferredoxin oxidoreductase beta subunit